MAKLSDYVNALQTIHAQDDFWVLDSDFNSVYTSNEQSLESFHVLTHNDDLGGFLNYLVVHKSQLNNHEVVVLPPNLGMGTMLLLSVNPIIEGGIIGYIVLTQGKVSCFERVNFLNVLLHGNNRVRHPPVALKEREREILYLLLQGKSYREIAICLSQKYRKRIPLPTIASIVCNSIYHKFGVHNILDLKGKVIETMFVEE